MKIFAKILIMLVRLSALVSIAFGVLIWSGSIQFVGMHIGLGFLITLLVGVLAVVGLAARVIGLGVLGLVFAFLLPYIGLKQFPLTLTPHFGAMQVAHVIIVVTTLGVAEALHARIAKS